MQKKLIGGFVIIGSLCVFNAYVLADSSCNTCYSSPTQLTEYIGTMQSISSSAATSGTGTIESTAVSTIKVYTDLLVALPREFIGQDALVDFKILFNGYPAVRDRKKLLDMDRTLSNNARRLASNGTFDKEISDSDLSRFNTKLSQLKFMKNFQVQKGAKYGDMIGVLWQVHKLYKEIFLAASYTNTKMDYDLDEYMGKAFKGYEGLFTTNGDYPSVDGNYITQLQSSYDCALGPSSSKSGGCSNSLDKFLDDMSKIYDTLKDSDKIFQRFSNARKKLQNALKGVGGKGFDDEYLQRHIKLKKQIELGPLEELLDSKKSTGLWSIGKLVQKMQDLKDGLRGTKEKDAEDLAGEAQEQNNSGAKSADATTTQSPYIKDLKEAYYKNMKTAFKSVLSVGRSMNDDIPQEVPDPSPTMDFPDLSKKVNIAKKQLKDIKSNFGEACEKQCKNVDADCGKND